MNTYIIHVSTATDREIHMLDLLKANSCLKSDWITEGDISSFNEEILNKYFSKNDMMNAQVSCALKHFLALEKFVQSEEKYAIILEDDIFVNKDFCEKIDLFVKEIDRRALHPSVISLEDSNMKFVDASVRKKGVYLYKKDKVRFTGALLIDQLAAKNILNYVKTNKCNQPIDWFYDSLDKKEIIKIYWSHPTIATQGSINGNVSTLIGNKRSGAFRFLSRRLQKLYKKIIYHFR